MKECDTPLGMVGVTGTIALRSLLAAALITTIPAPAPAQGRVRLVSVSAGAGIACAVADAEGRRRSAGVYCWGDDRPAAWSGAGRRAVWGPRGHASATPRAIALPAHIAPDSIVAMTVGASPFVCMALRNGRVWCWGENETGALGDGTSIARSSPVAVPIPEAAVEISAGEGHACARTVTGRGYCWGENEHGELGVADVSAHRGPMAVAIPDKLDVIAAGAAGASCALTDAGALRCWGTGGGEQGLPARDEPQVGPAAPRGIPGLRYRSLSVGNGFACAVDAEHVVHCWGANNVGQLGGGPAQMPQQQVVPLPAGERAASVSVGFQSACALTETGRIACWGRNDVGELGRMSDAPTDRAPGWIIGNSRYTAMSVGGTTACAITVSRTLECWGAPHHARRAEEAVMRRRSRPIEVVFP